jgi:hypothetical protein
MYTLVFVVFGWIEVCFCLLSAHGGHEVNQMEGGVRVDSKEVSKSFETKFSKNLP